MKGVSLAALAGGIHCLGLWGEGSVEGRGGGEGKRAWRVLSSAPSRWPGPAWK